MADRIDPRPGEVLFDPACGAGGFLTCSVRHMRDRYVKKVQDEQKMQAALRAVEKKQLPHMLCVTSSSSVDGFRVATGMPDVRSCEMALVLTDAGSGSRAVAEQILDGLLKQCAIAKFRGN